ncbi:MAG: hypothetical protein QM489_01270 [Candidatus Izemoplasma sp.]
MLKNYSEEITLIKEKTGKKLTYKLHLESLINLSNMINIQDNTEIENIMIKLIDLIHSIVNGNTKNARKFRKEFNRLKINVFNQYKFHHRGSIIEKSIGLGIIFGVAIGAMLSSVNSSLVGLGLVLGLAIGAGIGTKKERKLEEQNKLY